MNFKQLFTAVLLAAASTSAMATNFTQNVAITGNTTNFGQSHVGAAGVFSDTFNFTGVTGNFNVNLGLFSFGLSAAQNIDFTSVIFNGTPLTISNGLFVSTANTLANLNVNTPFTLTVNGISGSNASYSGVLNASAVPEPETYTLMLAGLGLVGFATRRKNNAA